MAASTKTAKVYGDGSAGHPPLDANGWCYTDWVRPAVLHKSKARTLQQGKSVRLKARLQWHGPGQPPQPAAATGEHVVLAFVQGNHPQRKLNCSWTGMATAPLNSPAHAGAGLYPSRLFNSGAGALLTPHGLALELWHPHRGDATALIWDAGAGRCGIRVPSGDGANQCLASTPGANKAYITPNADPHFHIEAGRYYQLQIGLTPVANEGGVPRRAWLKASLWREEAGQAALLQSARVQIAIDAYLPGGTLGAVLARTAPEGPIFYPQQNIRYWLTD